MSNVPQAQQHAPKPIHYRIENEPIPMIMMYDIALLLAGALIGFPCILFVVTFFGR